MLRRHRPKQRRFVAKSMAAGKVRIGFLDVEMKRINGIDLPCQAIGQVVGLMLLIAKQSAHQAGLDTDPQRPTFSGGIVPTSISCCRGPEADLTGLTLHFGATELVLYLPIAVAQELSSALLVEIRRNGYVH